MKSFFNRAFRYFMEGVVLVVPFMLTIILIIWPLLKLQAAFHVLVRYMPSLASLNRLPFLNLAAAIAIVTFLGYIASNFIIRSFINLLENLVMSVPIVNILYSYIKESTSAFVDKFDKPVLVLTNKALGSKKIGFITQESLANIGLSTTVAVYLPHSYSFSGELIFFPKEHIAPLNVSTTDAFRLILSGGLADIKPSLQKTRKAVNRSGDRVA